MPVERLLDEDGADLVALTREIAAKELAPYVDAAERDATFPREAFRTLGRAGLLGPRKKRAKTNIEVRTTTRNADNSRRTM